MARKLHGPFRVSDFPRHWHWHDRAQKNARVRYELFFRVETRTFEATVERRKSPAHRWRERPARPGEIAFLRALLPPEEIARVTALAIAYRPEPQVRLTVPRQPGLMRLGELRIDVEIFGRLSASLLKAFR